MDLAGVNQLAASLADYNGGGGTVTNSGGGNAALTLNPSAMTTFSGSLQDGPSATTALVLNGNGGLTLAGVNPLSGGVTIASGTLQLANVGGLPNSSVYVGVNNGLAFATGNTATTIGALSGGGNLLLQDGGSHPVTLTAGGNNASTAYSGILGGSGGLSKTGTGNLTLSNVNSYSGATTISSGTMTLSTAGNSGVLVNTNLLTVGSGATLNINGTGYNQFQSGTSSGTLAVSGLLEVTNNSPNTLYATTITLSGGTMTSTVSVPSYGAYYVSGLGTGRTITASGTGNVISAVNIGIVGGQTLTLNTPLATDSLTSSTTYFDNTAGAKLAKSGSGTVVLTGTSTYTGATTVSTGALLLNGGACPPAARFPWPAPAARLSAATAAAARPPSPRAAESRPAITAQARLTLTGLTFSGSGEINLTPSSIDALNVTSNNGLTASGGSNSVAVNIGTAPITAGTYPLIGFAGTIQGSGSGAFTLGTTPNDGNFYKLKLSGGTIDLFVALNAPYWSGANGTAWDTSTVNWQIGGAGGSSSTFSNGLPVVFDDTASGGTVAINGADVSPAGVTVSAGTLAYMFQGTNAITGSTGLTKNNAGYLTIANTNSFTGMVTLNGGTTAVGSIAAGGVNSPLGKGTSLVFGGGVLEYTGSDASPATDRAVTLNTGNGGLQIDHAGTMLTLSGSIGGVGGLAATGPGGLTLTNSANSFAGGMSANGGTLTVGSVANSGVNSPLGAGSSLTLSGGEILQYTGVDAAPSTNRGLTLATTGNQTVQVVNAATTLTLAGAIGGSGGLTKSGPGMLVLGNASNSYSGGTTVNGGTLQVTADGNLARPARRLAWRMAQRSLIRSRPAMST